jgi:pSer/pThr/pTyr-binding forkhead associated (FHA) protein
METDPDHTRETNTPETNDAIPKNALLIIEGVIVHVLKEAVINIGRKLGNHITIDDPRISRQHAQLRAINGHFVLFDLNSMGGTFVNGLRTSEIVLYPGDLISLAGVTLVYAQDDPTLHSDQVETAPLGESEAAELNQPPTPTMEKSTLNIKVSDSKSQKPGDTAAQEGRAGKYTPLEKYLRDLPESQNEVTLGFEQIESILNDKLPASAYEYPQWWENEKEGNHVNARAWANAGWKIESLDFIKKWVKLVRVG